MKFRAAPWGFEQRHIDMRTQDFDIQTLRALSPTLEQCSCGVPTDWDAHNEVIKFQWL